jgi:2-polyprenyl-3-methyl-5-hydroxy-6-metoxy-1,4-benzoquinol methylase
MKCRFDALPLSAVFVDLGFCPPSNSYLLKEQLNDFEAYYPLKLYVSDRTFLVQVDELKSAHEIFSEDYAYFSSFSKSWLKHAENYVAMMVSRFGIDPSWQVVELASNDGYLLQYFKQRGVPVLGIDPSLSVATAARQKGINTRVDFFGIDLARELKAEGVSADLLLGNNVLAHVPDLNDFVGGMRVLLSENGIITMEFPHLMRLVEAVEFDTIYHEHFSYFSFYTVIQIFAAHGLNVFDVDELSSHGGSLRIFAQHEHGPQPISANVAALLEQEKAKGMQTLEYYKGFQAQVDRVKISLLKFLIEQKEAGRKVAAYGAAAKGNTLLNFCGVRGDFISFVVDACDYKQGHYLPGSHIPIVSEERIREEKPDYIVILPWNLEDEIVEQLSYIREWGGQFVIPIPKLRCF